MPFKLKKHLCERFESCTTQSHISLANVCKNEIVYTECLHLVPHVMQEVLLTIVKKNVRVESLKLVLKAMQTYLKTKEHPH